MHEAQMHEENAFVTLTYDDEHYSPSLDYKDFQLFMRRVRKQLGPTRFFMCGEYGEINARAHFHVLLFGRSFNDGTVFGTDIKRSPTLEKLWTAGHSSYGEVTFQSAGYVARYALKKVTGPNSVAHYKRVDIRTGEYVDVEPEFGGMSLKPGIGYTWFQKYWKEVYGVRDGIVLKGGQVMPAPRFYDDLLSRIDSDLSEKVDFDRYIRSEKFKEDCSLERLLDREKCAVAKNLFLKRSL